VRLRFEFWRRRQEADPKTGHRDWIVRGGLYERRCQKIATPTGGSFWETEARRQRCCRGRRSRRRWCATIRAWCAKTRGCSSGRAADRPRTWLPPCEAPGDFKTSSAPLSSSAAGQRLCAPAPAAARLGWAAGMGCCARPSGARLRRFGGTPPRSSAPSTDSSGAWRLGGAGGCRSTWCTGKEF